MNTLANQKFVVLAEDDDEDVDIFKDALADLNMDVHLTVVKNGILLMDFLERSEILPDLIFLDLNMPLKNGLQCLKEIKNCEKFKVLNTVILSTSSNEEQKEEMYFHGANLFLTKASTYKEFKNNLANCFQIIETSIEN
jgi:CheY-like chemotaxis protein